MMNPQIREWVSEGFGRFAFDVQGDFPPGWISDFNFVPVLITAMVKDCCIWSRIRSE